MSLEVTNINYEYATELLNNKRGDKSRKKVGNNTHLELRDDDKIAVRLHSTDIITLYPNGDAVLNSGGWKTATTKDRLNELGFPVHQEQGQWYYGNAVFQDGMIVHADGSISGAGSEEDEAYWNKLKKRINKYAQQCTDALPLPVPDVSDCWFCHMQDQKTGKSLGDATDATDHLYSHMNESYIVPSLVYNALKERGFGELLIAEAFGQTDLRLLNGHLRSDVKRAVSRYMKKRFGLPA